MAVWTEGMEELNMMRQTDRLWGEEGSQPELGTRCTKHAQYLIIPENCHGNKAQSQVVMVTV